MEHTAACFDGLCIGSQCGKLFTRISAFVIIGIGIAKPGIADGDYRQKKLPEFLYRHGRGDHGLLTKEIFQNRTALIRIKSDPAIFPRVFRGSLVSGACACRDIKCLSGVEPVFLMLRPKRAGSFKNKMNQMVWLPYVYPARQAEIPQWLSCNVKYSSAVRSNTRSLFPIM